MKIVRCLAEEKIFYGLLHGETVRELAGSPFDSDWNDREPVCTGREYDLSSVQLLTPCQPTKFLGVGMNYKSVAMKLRGCLPDSPVAFLKPVGAVVASGEPICLPQTDEPNFLYEGELAVVIGKTARNVSREEAKDYILGCTCSNDVTDMRFMAHPEDLRMKARDSFGPIGPVIDTQVDPDNTTVRTWLNGELRQDGHTSDQIFDAAYMIAWFSSFTTLYPGDVISMGTPAGASNIAPGDVCQVEVGGVGTLINPVILADA